jgi:hypothetical protein
MAAFPYPRQSLAQWVWQDSHAGFTAGIGLSGFSRQIEALALNPLPGALAPRHDRSDATTARVLWVLRRLHGGGELWSLLDIDRRYRPNH